MKKTKKGFTLIELLVVIAIIGLLSTLSIVALNSARARSRDARRISDVKQMQTALELYYNDVGAYPPSADVSSSIATGSTIYMQIVPSSPTPADGDCTTLSNPYDYEMTDSGASYTLQYCLGATTGGLTAGIGTATPAAIQD